MIHFFLNINIKTLFALIAIFSITIVSMIARHTIELDRYQTVLIQTNKDRQVISHKIMTLKSAVNDIHTLLLSYHLQPTTTDLFKYRLMLKALEQQLLELKKQEYLEEGYYSSYELEAIESIRDKVQKIIPLPYQNVNKQTLLNITKDAASLASMNDSIAKILHSIEKRVQLSVVELEQAIALRFKRIFILLIIMVLSSLLIMLVIRQKVLVPIEYLLQVIKHFTKGDGDIQLKRYYDDEVGEMSNKFFIMKEKLDEDMQKIRDLAEKDSLTGIYNRRTFFKEAQNAIELMQNGSKHASLMILDIDFFKNINDTYGHIIGDKVLSHVVRNIEDQLSSSDIFARYGGEEFIILLPNREIDNAKILAQLICDTIASTPYMGSNELLRINITLSIGVAYYDTSLPLEDTIKIADEALYEAKESGRNKVVVA
jgi:diguanylate cyclase (GGDEF)-like protein